MQIRQQAVHLLRGQNISESIHFVPSEHNDVVDAIVVCRHSALAQVLFLENPLQAWALASARRIWRVAAGAVLVVNVASLGLLGIQPKFSVALPALCIAAGKEH